MINNVEFLDILREFVEQCSSQKEAAKRLGVSPAYLNDVLTGRREPGKKIIGGFGLHRVVMLEHQDESQWGTVEVE